MGLDIWLEKKCPTCKHVDQSETFHCTYNLAPMWYAMFPNDKEMVPIDGMTGAESLFTLRLALQKLRDYPEMFIPLNPGNGWGNYEYFMGFISNLIMRAEHNPELVWESWR